MEKETYLIDENYIPPKFDLSEEEREEIKLDREKYNLNGEYDIKHS